MRLAASQRFRGAEYEVAFEYSRPIRVLARVQHDARTSNRGRVYGFDSRRAGAGEGADRPQAENHEGQSQRGEPRPQERRDRSMPPARPAARRLPGPTITTRHDSTSRGFGRQITAMNQGSQAAGQK